jgi:hypothetical protein
MKTVIVLSKESLALTLRTNTNQPTNIVLLTDTSTILRIKLKGLFIFTRQTSIRDFGVSSAIDLMHL